MKRQNKLTLQAMVPRMTDELLLFSGRPHFFAALAPSSSRAAVPLPALVKHFAGSFLLVVPAQTEEAEQSGAKKGGEL